MFIQFRTEAGATYINKGGASGISDLAGEPDTWHSTFHPFMSLPSSSFIFVSIFFYRSLLCALDFPGHNQQNGELLGGAPCSGRMDSTWFNELSTDWEG